MITKRARNDQRGPRSAARIGLLLAAALAASLLTPAASASATTFSSFDAGVLAPGQVKHVHWNNANSDAYAAGVVGVNADDPDAICQATVTRTWYVRQASGEREFHLTVLGDPTDSCRVRVWLGRLSAFRTVTTATIPAGGGSTRIWSNAHLEQNTYLIGVVPSVPTSSAPCQFEVTPRYQTRPDGQTQFAYTTTNVGAVACSAELRMVSLPITSSYDLGGYRPGGKVSLLRPPFETATNVVVPGLNPQAVPDGICQWSVQEAETEELGSIWFDYANTGVTTCGAVATFAPL